MNIVVIGGTGLIGSRTVARLRRSGHEAIAASPASGVDTMTGEGLAAAMAGADVVVDLANSPSFEDRAVMDFFQTSGRNLMAAGVAAGVRHHVVLSVVGTDRLQGSGYFRGKQAQEHLVRDAGIPFTIVRSTQFFEFMGAIAKMAAVDGAVRVATAPVEPIAADDVAEAVAGVALAAPAGGMIEIAGAEHFRLCDAVARYLEAVGDPREVIPDPAASYYGVTLDERSLVPATGARRGATRYADWLGRMAQPAPALQPA